MSTNRTYQPKSIWIPRLHIKFEYWYYSTNAHWYYIGKNNLTLLEVLTSIPLIDTKRVLKVFNSDNFYLNSTYANEDLATHNTPEYTYSELIL